MGPTESEETDLLPKGSITPWASFLPWSVSVFSETCRGNTFQEAVCAKTYDFWKAGQKLGTASGLEASWMFQRLGEVTTVETGLELAEPGETGEDVSWLAATSNP